MAFNRTARAAACHYVRVAVISNIEQFTAYNCADGLVPLRQNGRVMQCDLALDVEAWQVRSHF